MARAPISVILSVLAGVVALAENLQPSAAPPSQAGLRVLFIGNSYTYYNNVPCMVGEIAKARGRTIVTELRAEGGASLADHWRTPATRDALKQTWDAVVLQAQSTFGKTYLVAGIERVADTGTLQPDVAHFAEALKGRATRLFLHEHWKRLAAPERDQSAIAHAFDRAARSTDSTVIPSGLAWSLASAVVPPASLYDIDEAHPSPEGSYLSALTIYASLTGDTPVGAPAAISCPNADPDVPPAPISMQTVRIDSARAPLLQEAARKAVETYPTKPKPEPAPIDLPELPRSVDKDAAFDDGEWRGTSELYPRFFPWPAKMSLTVLTATSARLTLSFGGRPVDIVREVALSHEGGVIRFEDPSGPNESVVKYRGVLRGDTIEGVAEFTGTTTLYGIGTWKLNRFK